MGQSQLKLFMKEYNEQLQNELKNYISTLNAPEILKSAMDYSLQAGGKRIRPILLFATLQAFHQDPKKGLETALALEMIHTYSLIHDDLPSMDDDDLRRGKPTNHKVFGEGYAILAGDALLTYAFQIIAQTPHYEDHLKVKLIEWLAKGAGPEGMVGGQVADIEGETKNLTLEELQNVHKNKTGKLLAYGILAGAMIAEATAQQLEILQQFASHLGIAFQIKDDILDVEGDEAKIGKKVGSDSAKDKSTYPSLLSLDGAKEKLQYHIQEATKALNKTGLETDLLQEMVTLIATRES
ncbi:geranylgeranyl diphosphate synthase type II [Oikeobacillus pervagus]|uniref:Farnesyl diphosphate synthase n=1 Tax=Oikeobacillus pervagus TaxID=1325931 RepID=A0AAJ1SYV1_9BACI|nr:farnesyl diphosphate synthase [Oikeobacillus pervagus]MDQ0213821.1 geranylgeranyl diphosphate synthase type II [Oikeobacillus pervagus]